MWLEPSEGERKGRGDGGWIRQSLISYGKDIGFYFEGGEANLAITTFAEVKLGVRNNCAPSARGGGWADLSPVCPRKAIPGESSKH